MNSVNVFKLESLATMDGDGIRYAIYLKGCPLRCVYCHNPESWNTVGRPYTKEQLLSKILRYKSYFGRNGGVTWSGGEPLLYSQFINDINTDLINNKINYVLDTSGCVELNDSVKLALSNASMVILDIKFWDKESYSRYSGGNFDQMIAVGDYLESIAQRVWLRTVIVPDINDTYEHIDKYIDIYKKWNNVEKYELLAFHTMGFNKYEQLGVNNPLLGTKDLDMSKLRQLQNYLNSKLDNK